MVVIPLETGSNFFRLGFRCSLEIKNGFDRPFPPYFGNNRWSGGASLPEGSELQMDARGNILRLATDYPLPLPLGSVLTALFQPLPAAAHAEGTEKMFVADAPHWLGPTPLLLPAQGYGPPYFQNYGPRQNVAAAAVAVRTEWKTISTEPDRVTLHKKTALESLGKFAGHPQITASGEGDLVFNPQLGLFTRMELACVSRGDSETVSRENRVTLKIRLLTGKERADVLAPPPPAPPVSKKITGDDLQKLFADLKAGEPDKRRAAAGRLAEAELESPTPELIELMAAQANDEDSGVRQFVANFLNNYGSVAQVPVLLKLLKDSEDNICQTATKTLTRLKDARAIEPLAELLAGGVRVNQYNQIQNFQFISDLVAALQSFGATAEKPVAALLPERSIETRRQACLILKQIGTAASLDALQKVVGDMNPQVNVAAAEAIRAIKQRQ